MAIGMDTDDSKGQSKFDQLLQQMARPALWDLMRKKLLHVNGVNLQRAFYNMSLKTLEAIIHQQFRDVKKMSLNLSAFSSFQIGEVCTSLRQAAWLHTLRIVSICQTTEPRNGKLMSGVLAKILSSDKYKLVLGLSNWKDLHGLVEALGGNVVHLNQMTKSVDHTNKLEKDSTLQPPQKKQRIQQIKKQNIPVRAMCSVGFLEQLLYHFGSKFKCLPESQFERFLVSTRIVNHFTAQSLLHKICMEDLFCKRLFNGGPEWGNTAHVAEATIGSPLTDVEFYDSQVN
ncbi:hypothetical protein PHMEG_00032228 [Phytophthora megakarya]|uniref:Uncharacterized protein n=1 Tax=Phytophthora megakarya TaxID=4795 RepID=A0A225UWT5_9STRA|nr:hypothetical protein PHMEG_00032228 [Phytophthora megakarya]